MRLSSPDDDVDIDGPTTGTDDGCRAVPVLDLSDGGGDGTVVAYDIFAELYGDAQALLIRGCGPRHTTQDPFGWRDAARLHAKIAGGADAASWTVETSAPGDGPAPSCLSPGAFLRDDGGAGRADDAAPAKRPRTEGRGGYCSFTVQHDAAVLAELLADGGGGPEEDGGGGPEGRLPPLPVPSLPVSGASGVREGPCVWFFFGRNTSAADMAGRPEHTDCIRHDGTWHYQLAGTKVWHLRPTAPLLRRWGQAGEDGDATGGSGRTTVTCRAGDVFVLNTALWFHATSVPAGGGGKDCVSLSYARDIFLPGGTAPPADGADGPGMTNLDGLYATDDVAEGDVIFTEDAMPGCELHRSARPNCEVVELEKNGATVMAVVAARDIRAGEFFCVAESDDEDDDESDDEEDGEGGADNSDDEEAEDWSDADEEGEEEGSGEEDDEGVEGSSDDEGGSSADE